jgi:transposase
MAPNLVTPHRMSGKRGKNDAADAAATGKALQRPNMGFLPIKTEEQQARLMVHCARPSFVTERTACINRICGLLSEVAYLYERVKQYDVHIRTKASDCTAAHQLTQLMSVGQTTATAIVAMVGNAREFTGGRPFSAWIGLVSVQHGTGGTPGLGRINKAGNPCLRSLLVMAARLVLNAAKSKTDSLSPWAVALEAQRGYWNAVAAIAAKNARMCWALLNRGESIKLPA